ncbi:MAG TPA: pitrilysin family protein [Candidatus Kapabacteria bacterium]|nr:pitrilysin family protein [Candidatus Kapabacteria bacterium]
MPPKPGPLTKVSFPKFEEGTLSNGLEVWTVQNHEQPIVSLSLYVRAGSSLDPRHREGLAASVADLLTKGTARRSATEIAEAIDFIGGSLNASAGWDALTVNISVLTKYLDVAIDLLSDIIQHSTFPDEEVERMRLQRLAGIRQAKADAGFLADMVFSKLVFAGHPYGQQPIGTEHSILEMKREDILQFARQYLTPSNSFLTAAGDIVPDEFRKLLETATASWSGPAREIVMSYGDASMSAHTQVGLINREGAVQSALRVGHLGIRRNTPDFLALSALNMLLGGYFNSRINLNLREVHGYTYGARSFFDTRMAAGPFAVSTEVRTEVTVRAVEEIVSEISRATQLPVEEDELRMVKDYMIGSFPLQIETPQQVAGRVATIVLYGLERNYWDTYREKLSALTSVELYRVAREYLHPSELTITASGNVQAIEAGMAEFGEVKVFDDEGSLVETPVFI